MRQQRLWPNGLRYLWTDAFGVVLLVSLYHELRGQRDLVEAEWLVAEVKSECRAGPGASASARPRTGTAKITDHPAMPRPSPWTGWGG